MPVYDFKGKSVVQNLHLSVPYHEIRLDRERSFSSTGGPASMDGNLIVHGDNLKALKALLPRYGGRIKCAYIDPPYNTGKDNWAYNDRVDSPLIAQWFQQEVKADDLERHDKWACMIYPRLKLIWELLANTGVLFVHIDDNEMHNLRAILDEIFGERNWIGTIVWKNATDNNPTRIAIEHEYIVCYAKRKDDTPPEWTSPVSEVRDRLSHVEQTLLAKFQEPIDLQRAYRTWFRA